MRYFILAVLLITSQYSIAQKKPNWTIETSSSTELATGAGFTLLGADSVQLITDTIVQRFAIADITKVTHNNPGRNGLYGAALCAAGVATFFVISFLHSANNTSSPNDTLSGDEKLIGSIIVANAGILIGGSIGFLAFNRKHKHHVYDLTGMTPEEKDSEVKNIWRRMR